MADPDQQEISYIRIPVSPETKERLLHVANMSHADPEAVAGSIVHDVLKDDEEAHFLDLLPRAGRA